MLGVPSNANHQRSALRRDDRVRQALLFWRPSPDEKHVVDHEIQNREIAVNVFADATYHLRVRIVLDGRKDQRLRFQPTRKNPAILALPTPPYAGYCRSGLVQFPPKPTAVPKQPEDDHRSLLHQAEQVQADFSLDASAVASS